MTSSTSTVAERQYKKKEMGYDFKLMYMGENPKQVASYDIAIVRYMPW